MAIVFHLYVVDWLVHVTVMKERKLTITAGTQGEKPE
jgi:hypothetical protein